MKTRTHMDKWGDDSEGTPKEHMTQGATRAQQSKEYKDTTYKSEWNGVNGYRHMTTHHRGAYRHKQ